MSHKQHFEEVNQLDEVQNPIASATLHGALLSLSKIKKGRRCNYFDGTLSDGTKELRLVGFASEQHKKLTAYREQNLAVQLHNCEVKQSRQGHQFEILLKTATKITQSTRPIEVPETDESIKTTNLIEITLLINFQKITVDIKVIDVHDPITVNGGKQKQDVIIADATATAKVTLWEKSIDLLVPGHSYTLKNFAVREYNAVKYLSMPREDAEIIPIPDIGDVAEVETESDIEHEQVMEYFNPQIIGVPYLDKYKACIKCKARVEPLTPPLGRCSRNTCAMLQRFDLCLDYYTAKFVFLHGNNKRDTLNVFGKFVTDFAEVNEEDLVTPKMILESRPITRITFNEKKIITGFARSM